MSTIFSTARGRVFGVGMLAAMEAAKLNGSGLAKLAGWDASKVSNMLNGRGVVDLEEVSLLLGICRTPLKERERLRGLFAARNVRWWWQPYDVCVPERSDAVTVQLAAAETLIGWDPHVVPLLLRTAEYERELLAASATVPADEVEERVRGLLAIQQSLPREADCTFYVHEVALRLQIGGRTTQAEQLHHLMVNRNRKVRVVPASVGAHAGVAGAFTWLTFARFEPLVWMRAESSSLFVETEEAAHSYEAVVRKLDEVSLGEDESLDFIVSQFVGLQDSVGVNVPEPERFPSAS